MADLFKRIQGIMESLIDDNLQAGRRTGDPDLDEAWRELDRELGDTPGWSGHQPQDSTFDDMDRTFREFDRRYEAATGHRPTAPRPGAPGPGSQEYRTWHWKTHHMTDEELRKTAEQLVQDYRNLELKPGSSIDEVRAAYKKMMKTYHPDRFADSAEKQAIAHQVSVKLNESFQRILKYLE